MSRSSVAEASRPMKSSLETSSTITRCSTPKRLLNSTPTSLSKSSRRATRTMLIPEAAICRANSLPIPDEAPVTSAQGPNLFLSSAALIFLLEAMRILHDELPNIEVTVSSQYSPDLADALMRGRLDAAFMRSEKHADNLVYRRVTTEPLVVVFPSDHRLAAHDAVELREIVGETFIIPSNTAPTLRAVIDDYLKRSGLDIIPDHEVDNLAHAVSMIASTRAVALLPVYAKNFLPWSVTSRPIRGDAPTVDLVIGWNKANTSPTLKLFLSRVDDLAARMSSKAAPGVIE